MAGRIKASSLINNADELINLDDLEGDLLPAGGATDDVLAKTSGTDGDVNWDTLHAVARSGSYSALSGKPTLYPFTSVRKTADQTRSNTTSLVVDDILQFAMAANTKYTFRLVAYFDPGNTSAGFRFDHNGPASPTQVRIHRRHIVSGGGNYAGMVVDTDYLSTLGYVGFGSASGANGGIVLLDGIIHNGANAGQFQFRWSQHVEQVIGTIVRAGSYIEHSVS